MTRPVISADAHRALLLEQVRELCSGENSDLSILSNVAALLYGSLRDLNWLGFYLRSGDDLYVGPFQGKPACVRIPMGRGVCGAAAERMSVIVVPDVEAFPGHIACDAASRSEIVVPLIREGRCIGVLDADSPSLDRFDENDRRFLESVADLLIRGLGRTPPELVRFLP